MTDTATLERPSGNVTTQPLAPYHDYIPLALINVEGGTQMRVDGLDKIIVNDYRKVLHEAWERAVAQAEKDGEGVDGPNNILDYLDFTFPDVVLFYDGDTYHMADGHHRYEAFKQEEIPVINATIHQGTLREARLYACGANESHGLRRTIADKRKSVMEAIKTLAPDGIEYSNRKIAEICRVSHPFVSDIRTAQERAAAYDTSYNPDGDEDGTAGVTAGPDGTPVAPTMQAMEKLQGQANPDPELIRQIPAGRVLLLVFLGIVIAVGAGFFTFLAVPDMMFTSHGAFAAMGRSFRACVNNVPALIVFYLLLMVSLIALLFAMNIVGLVVRLLAGVQAMQVIVQVLLMAVLMPVLTGAMYHAWKSLLGGAMQAPSGIEV